MQLTCGQRRLPLQKDGTIILQGEIKTSYQKRWFVLKGNLLFYKERPYDRDVIGVIVLEGCTVQLCESEEQFAFSLVWSEPGLRTYKFAAEDEANQESWIKALLSANHSYLALLVMDMEKKYKDALGAFTSQTSSSKPFTMLNFSTAGAEYPSASLSALTSHPAAVAGPSLGPNPLLRSPAASSKTASKRSPKLWPKRSANVVPVNTPALPVGEWSGVCLGTMEEFSKLHEDFGKEVKELIADWSKRGHRGVVVQEDNLIDFG
ncbi:sesquipedalian-1-like isoform X2 [Parambassis ranga]|uniref:Sesquipedalian n=1 Tax=Parambassis ranga TaxID=210632 RepID=A0A6P7KC16_9TELE|nr:sesquipedalian-1-like isoform X2 [Parambassis ranga]